MLRQGASLEGLQVLPRLSPLSIRLEGGAPEPAPWGLGRLAP